MRTISSRQNPSVRRFRELAAQGDPSGERLLLDGAHLVHDARRAGLGFDAVIVSAARVAGGSEEASLAAALERDGVEVGIAAEDVFAAASPVRTPSGIVAIARRTAVGAAEVLAAADLVVVAVDVQDPGNLGATIRTAEAFGAHGVLVCHSGSRASASPFSWKALRGSMGSALRMPIAAGLDAAAVLDRLRGDAFRTVAAVARHGENPEDVSWQGRMAILLGGEGPGLPDAIAQGCDVRVTIPMSPEVESLNVAVAGALLLYGARRAR